MAGRSVRGLALHWFGSPMRAGLVRPSTPLRVYMSLGEAGRSIALPHLSAVRVLLLPQTDRTAETDSERKTGLASLAFLVAAAFTASSTNVAHCGIYDGHRITGKDTVPLEQIHVTADHVGVLELQELLVSHTRAFCNDGAQDSKARAFAMHTLHPDHPPIPDDVKESWLKYVIPRLQLFGQFFKKIIFVGEGPHGGLGKGPTNTKRDYGRMQAYTAAMANVSFFLTIEQRGCT